MVSSVVQDVSHLVSIHDRLWAFQPCLVRRRDDGSEGVHEEWLPGCHYDLGRQRFRFWRSGGGLLEKFASIISFIPFLGHGGTVQPNLVLSDLALRKMLEQIRKHNEGNILLQESPLDVLDTLDSPIARNSRGSKDLGSGDVYDNIVNYGPFGSWAGSSVTQAFGQLAFWRLFFDLRERVIPTGNANVYRYGWVDSDLPAPQILIPSIAWAIF